MAEVMTVKRYVFWGIILGIIVLSYLMLKNLLVAVLSAIVLAYIVKPLYDRLTKKFSPQISAIITILVSLLVVLLVIGTMIGSIVSQLSKLLSREAVVDLLAYVSKIMDVSIVQENFPSIVAAVGDALVSIIPTTITYIPEFILGIFVVFFVAYYALIDWDKFEKKIVEIIPFKNKHEMVSKLKKNTTSIIRGTLLVAIIEAIIAGVVLWLLGVEAFLILAILIGILAFIPAMGPALVWVPLLIIELLLGNVLVGVGVLILGITLSMGIDSILRVKLLGGKMGLHPVVVLIGIIGGIQLLGIMGIILGPIILSIIVGIIENIPSSK